VIELKDARMRKRLVDQVEGYAALIDLHPNLFAELFGVLLGEPVHFVVPAEKWIVWPAKGVGPDPHENELANQGIRVVGYSQTDAAFELQVGKSPRIALAEGRPA
jgi:hypothetical protein